MGDENTTPRSRRPPPHLAPLALALLVAAGTACGPPRPTNVLLVVVDTLRADHLGSYGYPRDTSPNIDRLAAHGVRFDQALAPWPETRQSMAAMLSGLYCKDNGVVSFLDRPVSQELTMLPEILGAAGYQTAAAVENRALSRRWGYSQGFDHYAESWENDGTWLGAEILAERWLREDRRSGRPFFLWAHFLDPHADYAPKAPYDEIFVGDAHYDPSQKVEVRDASRMHDAYGGFPGVSRLGDHDELAYYVAQYDAEIRAVDDKVARLIGILRDLDLLDHTLVIVTSDHGEGFGEHDYYWHGFFTYEEVSRIPLVVSHASLAPRSVDQVVSLVDLVPTLLDLLGLPPGEGLAGTSLLPLLKGEPETPGRRVFIESGHHADARQVAIRDERYKLIHVPNEEERERLTGAAWELYDLLEDPGETRNLVEERPQVTQEMTAELERWMQDASPPEAVPAEVSEEERRQLEALGYAVDRP